MDKSGRFAAVLGLALAALAALAGSFARAASPSLTPAELADQAVRGGEDSYMTARTAKTLGLPSVDYDTRELEAPQELCEDGLNRGFAVLMTRGKAPRPRHLWFRTIVAGKAKSESYDYRATLSGRLVAAARTDGLLDSEGNVIQAPGRVARLDARDAAVRGRFERELGFWLRGEGRKPR